MSSYLFIFFGYSLASILLIFLPKIFLRDNQWFTISRFRLEYPEKAWLPRFYKLLILLWVFSSLTLTVRYFQGIAWHALLFLTIFVPFWGIGFIIGVMEAGFGISVCTRVRRATRGEVGAIWFRAIFFSIRFIFEYYFALDKEHFHRIGMIRAFANLTLLISLTLLPW
jgi:hypothetical protein